ncbi:hypothetical protein LCGC14_0669410 [marine sediment metagenome]|uniref:Uncharacterized protein n=1 Tax=marine sediment metagenome TaxID=412755 RepID=A0A0F9RBL8_9ZZZZ
MSINATWMGFWICVAFVICFVVSLLTLPNIDKPSDNEIMVELVAQGISPAVMECLSRNWNQIPVYEICKTVLTNNDLTREEAEELVNELRQE